MNTAKFFKNIFLSSLPCFWAQFHFWIIQFLFIRSLFGNIIHSPQNFLFVFIACISTVKFLGKCFWAVKFLEYHSIFELQKKFSGQELIFFNTHTAPQNFSFVFEYRKKFFGICFVHCFIFSVHNSIFEILKKLLTRSPFKK